MSTAAVGAYAGSPPKRPGYWRLFGASAFAQLAGGVCLFGVVAVLSWTSVVGVNSGPNLLIYAPWVIDGPWALAASIGWAAFVSMLIGSILASRAMARSGATSSVLIWASVAIGGYVPWLVTASSAGRTGLSLFAMPAVLRVVAFDGDGQPRLLRPRFEIPRGIRVAALLGLAGALVAPFTLLHPLSVHGSGGAGGYLSTGDSGYLYRALPGEPAQVEVGLQVGLFPITVTGVRLVDVPRGVRVIRVVLGSDAPLLRSQPTTSAPVHVAARQLLWIGYAAALTRCPGQPVAITRIRLSYRELGLSLSQTVPLAGSNTFITCGD